MADLLTKARAQGDEFDSLSKPIHPVDLIAKQTVLPNEKLIVKELERSR
ncbi:MAG TPA: hypothetical protein VGG18_14535 [Granulicella sp.]|jgi:hypothetical protein